MDLKTNRLNFEARNPCLPAGRPNSKKIRMTEIQIYQTPSDVIASEAKQSHGIASSLSLLAMTTFFEGISNLFRISIFGFRI